MPLSIGCDEVTVLRFRILSQHDMTARADDAPLLCYKPGAAIEMPLAAIRAFVECADRQSALFKPLKKFGWLQLASGHWRKLQGMALAVNLPLE